MMKTSRQTWLPDSVPNASVGSAGEAGTKWSAAHKTLRSIVAIIVCEIRLQLRSIAFWVLLAVFSIMTGIFAHAQISTPTHYLESGQAAVAIGTYEEGFVLFLLPFLLLSVFDRDKQRKVRSFLWTRPLAPVTYAFSKGLAAAVLSLCVGLLPLLVGWIVAGIARGSIQPIEAWLAILPVLAASNIMIALFALFYIRLTPVPLLGALIATGTVLYVDIFLTKTTLVINNLTAATTFYATSIGFGPDGNLLLWQRLSFLALAVCALGLLMLVYQLSERQGFTRFFHWLYIAAVLILGLGLLLPSLNNFQHTAGQAEDLGPTSAPPIKAAVSQYQLKVSADPDSGQVQGTASFLFVPQEQIGNAFFVALNPGLQVQTVTLSTTGKSAAQETATFTENTGWVHILTGDIPAVIGQALRVKIAYAGTMTLGRDYYAAADPGFGSGTGTATNYQYFSYLGQGIGALQGAAGSWYPLPWTMQALRTYGTRIPIDDLQIKLPASLSVYSALGSPTHSADGQAQEITAHPHSSLPEALIAALSAPQQIAEGSSTILYQGMAPDERKLQSYRLASAEAVKLNQWLRPDQAQQSLRTIIVPILATPAIGPGLLFIPEAPVVPTFGVDSEQVIARENATQLAYSWWLNAVLFPFQNGEADPSTQVPNGATYSIPDSHLLEMFSYYSAAVATDDVVGNGFLTQERNVCQGEHDVQGTGKSIIDPNRSKLLRQQMAVLGIEYCQDEAMVLHRLQVAVGFPAVTTLLQTYIKQHAQTSTDLRAFLVQASTLQGKNIVPDAGRYICSGTSANAPGTADPLACINQEGALGT